MNQRHEQRTQECLFSRAATVDFLNHHRLTLSMKVSFIEVHYKKGVAVPAEHIGKLPKRVMLFSSVQFHDQLAKIKEQLEKNGITVTLVRPRHACYEGQLLGCSMEDWS
jgi:diphthamide biosynthesis enzyme Dph1/Dph2-like protein